MVSGQFSQQVVTKLLNFFIPVQRATHGTRFNLATCNFMNDVIITSSCLCLMNREMLKVACDIDNKYVRS